uniref:RNase H type-1 domain-containing protein n=1 Tax=Fibrocapsa japonica TaxID=94617 RepID=A0A6U1LVX6_9STRA|mmetsp:Transcript_12387/g.18263  ORF Transcript_12387/g.18263 Transcript_12387/m.18263 type:complete len:243 (+) Transcript_12387:13-741(+)
MAKKKFYAIANGRNGPKIVRTWKECSQEVQGFSGAVFKGFSEQAEAETFLLMYGVSADLQESPGEENKSSQRPNLAKAWVEQHGGARDPLEDEMEEKAPEKPAQDRPVMFFDGASRGNPGEGGAGAVIYTSDSFENQLWRGYRYLGECTNNEAEYTAFLLGLQAAADAGIQNLKVCGDSMLVINQATGKWKVNAENLMPLHENAKKLIRTMPGLSLRHVPREENTVADGLANQALDSKSSNC